LLPHTCFNVLLSILTNLTLILLTSTAVRVLTLELNSGKVLHSVEQAYSEGENGVFISNSNSLLARQSAADYVLSMKKALEKSKTENKKILKEV